MGNSTKKTDKQYREGFSWAMCSHHLDDMPIAEIESHIDASRLAGTYNAFDAGAAQALDVIAVEDGAD